jgi:enediyne biosynthesis protein E5
MPSMEADKARVAAKPGILPFAIAITILNLLGHLWLGFEQAWLTPLVSLAAAYASELAVELLLNGWRLARFRGSLRNLIVFLLPAHITGLAVSMLLYSGEQFVVVAFASSLAIFSKVLLRVRVHGTKPASVHFMNPSNFGITVTLVIYHEWVSVAQPYQFTENVSGSLDWLLPAIVVCSGSLLNWRATRRIPLVLAWLAGFIAQAICRALVSPQDILFLLSPMTGLAFVLFTFYMITDPVTTPKTTRGQVAFGAATAVVYGVLTYLGVVFGLFFSLTIVCGVRGVLLWMQPRRAIHPAATARLEAVVGD